MTPAFAGGFGVREQSAYYLGSAFAGAGTGDQLSSMFWNPAATAAVEGINTESHLSVVFPDSREHATGGAFTSPFFGLDDDSGNLGDVTAIPASYFNYQLNERWFFGVAMNSPFGFTTKPEHDWAGSPIGETSHVSTININPNLAYKLTPDLSIGVGLQIERLRARLTSEGVTLPIGLALPGRETEVDDWGIGATAGLTWTPRAGTTIGIGYRSPVSFELDGKCSGAGLSTLAASGTPFPCNGDVHTDITLPETVTVGLRQQITPQWAALVGFEWTNWSRLTEYTLKNSAGQPKDFLPLNYEDGWMVSLGAEYAYSPKTTLRAGVAWEKSPITDENRSVLLPDADRFWVSVGATHKFSDKVTMDIAYAHLFFDDASIKTANPLPVGGPFLLTATADTDVDIVSASLKVHLGTEVAPLEPLK